MMLSKRFVMIEIIEHVDYECCPFLVDQCSLGTIINPHSTGNCLIICWLLGHAFIPPTDILNSIISIATGPGADQLNIDTKHSEEKCVFQALLIPWFLHVPTLRYTSPGRLILVTITSSHPLSLGEVVYRMGGQFWPSRCYARLMGELLVIHRSGKQRLGSCRWCWSWSSMVSQRGSTDHS